MQRRRFLQASGASLALPYLSTAQGAAKPKIKIGQIGVGHAHASKLSVYRQSEDYEVVGLVEPDDMLLKKAIATPPYRDLPVMTREQLLNSPGLEAVMIETRVCDLLDNAEVCVAAGKHVHIDKPAGESLPQLKRILDSATKQKRIVQMGYMFRYNPAVLMLREFLQKGWLGQIFELHTTMSKVVPTSGRRELAEYPGGIMFELGCHVIDLVVGTLGKPTRVTAFPQHVASVDDKLMDSMLAVFEYSKATATVRSSAVEVDGGARRHLVVCGTEGTFQIQPLDNPSVKLTLDRPRGVFKKGYQEITIPKYSRYVGDAADMARVIRGEKTFEFSPEHDYAVQETLLLACGLKTNS